ncbi:MAG: sodium:solute symporter [Hyphomicrobiaceae bacterium]
MSIDLRPAAANPRIGAYFGIFTSAFAALAVLMLILEQLGDAGRQPLVLMLAGPIAVYLAIGLSSIATDPAGYFAAGRAMPSVSNGLAAAMAVFGGTGFVAVTGAFYFLGFDALAYPLGICTGLLVSSVMIMPYVRKDGSYTLAGYLSRRFESRALRSMTGAALTVPALLLLVAELKIGSVVASRFLEVSELTAMAVLGLVVCLCAALGGLRGVVWTGTAQGIVALIGLLVPVTALAVILTNLPLPQLTYGTLADDVLRLEAGGGLVARAVPSVQIVQPGTEPEVLVKPFMQAFGATGRLGFLALMFTIALGVASMPALATRAGTCRSVFEVRRSMGWTIAIACLLALTMPAIGMFVRFEVLSSLAGRSGVDPPAWASTLARLGLAGYDAASSQLTAMGMAVARDAVPFLVSLGGGFPETLVGLTLAAVVSAALAGATAQAVALSGILAEDVVFAWTETGDSGEARVATARILLGVVVLLAGWLALSVAADPLTLFVWALALAASSAFPLLIMSVWWKRINQWGAIAGLATGYGIALVMLLAGLAGALPSSFSTIGAYVAPIAVPIGALTAAVVSLMTPNPEKRLLELVRDIRVPGGEAVYDREVRLASIGKKR